MKLRYASVWAVACLLLGGKLAQAQDVILEESVPTATETKKGPNSRHYLATYWGIASAFGPTEPQLLVRQGISGNVEMLLNYKLKLSGLLAVSVEAAVRHQWFVIKQTAEQIYPYGPQPAGTDWDRQRISTWAAGLAGNVRINFDPKRGNTLGKFLELGAGIDFPFSSQYKSWYEKAGDDSGEDLMARRRNLQYIQQYYGFSQAKLGLGKFNFLFRYRLSRLISVMPEWQHNVDMPAFHAGFQFTIN